MPSTAPGAITNRATGKNYRERDLTGQEPETGTGICAKSLHGDSGLSVTYLLHKYLEPVTTRYRDSRQSNLVHE